MSIVQFYWFGAISAPFCYLLYLFTTLCIAQQNPSIGVNVVCEGSPSRILKVRRISLGITILPKSSTLLTTPVAFIYLSPLQMLQRTKAPLCKGGWQKSLIFDWGIVFVDALQSLRHGLRRATPRPLLSASQTFSPLTGKSTLYTREACKKSPPKRVAILLG